MISKKQNYCFPFYIYFSQHISLAYTQYFKLYIYTLYKQDWLKYSNYEKYGVFFFSFL